jgi:hypothetical protein
MKEKSNKADWKSTPDKSKLKQASAHEVDPRHPDVKHDEALGRVGIAPSKPVWPSQK